MEKIKLLVVDDIPQTRKDITRLLYFEDDMIVLGESGDGVEAVRKIGELQPDVVLMDINMPQMDGISATERVSHLYPQVAVIIISIQGESEYLKKAMVAGARDYLVKPLGSEEMANAIRSVYKQQRMRQVKYVGKQAAHPVDSLPAPAVIPQQQGNGQISAGERRYLEQHTSHMNQSHCVEPPCYRPDCGKNEPYSDHSNRSELPPQETPPLRQDIDCQPQTFYWESRQINQPNLEEELKNRPGNPLPQDQQEKPYANDLEQQSTRESMQSATRQPQGTLERIDEPRQELQKSTIVHNDSEEKQEKKEMVPAREARVEKASHEHRAQPTTQSDEKPLGFVTVVFSGKGGVGTTTIATNLAVSLAQQEKKKVALIDYDLQFGDISVLLNLSEGKNIGDMVRDESEITDEILENYLIRHFSGIDILPAPLFPQEAEYITADHTEQILQLLKKSYDYIIVDTAGSFDEINLRVMDLADRILLVATRDIITIKNTKTSLSILESLSYREKIRIVLNRGDQDLGVEIADLEKGLEMTVSHQVTSDERALISSINKGVPVVISHSNTEISRSFKRLSDRLINVRRSGNSEKQSRGIITRMFSL